jgi:hypothetical protein
MKLINTKLFFTIEQFEKLKIGKPSTMDSKFGFKVIGENLIIFRGNNDLFYAKIKNDNIQFFIDEFEVLDNFSNYGSDFETKLLFDGIVLEYLRLC